MGMEAVRGPVIDRAHRQYAAMLTYAALDPGDTFTTAELATPLASYQRMGYSTPPKRW